MRTHPHPLALLFAIGIGLSVPARAAVDMFLEIEGIKGESKDTRHRGEIEVLSWSWGASNPTRLGTGGLGSGKVSFSDLSITKYPDRSTPALLAALASGQPLRRGVLTVRTKGGVPTEFHRFFGDSMFVTGYSVNTDNASGRPRETISLSFGLFAVRNIRIEPDGSQAPQPDFLWDTAKGEIGSILLPPFAPITDTDGDGIPDLWAVQYGLDPLLPHRDDDTDGDGATDYEEFVAGTNPTSKNSVFKSEITFPPDGRTASLAFPSAPGKNYRILSAPSPDEKFELLFEIPASAEGSTSVPIPLESALRFFRVQVVEPQNLP